MKQKLLSQFDLFRDKQIENILPKNKEAIVSTLKEIMIAYFNQEKKQKENDHGKSKN